jgi:integron integrase
MNRFEQYLSNQRIVPDKKIPFFLHWVKQCYLHCNKPISATLGQDEIDSFLMKIAKRKEDWQVDQARMAINLYGFHKSRIEQRQIDTKPAAKQWAVLKNDMVRIMRLKHLSLSSEKTYIGWLRSFGRYLGFRHPEHITGNHVKDFLTWQAVERRVSVSTQNQAFNALLFFFRHVLNKEIGDLGQVVRAAKKRRMPVVLTKPEVERLLSHVSGRPLLAAEIIYGCGLRLRECIKLRIKDIDFERQRVIVMAGKGNKDRQTLLPECLIEKIKVQMEHSRKLFEHDRRNNVPGVELPFALERKYPNAGKQWGWHWLFPSGKLSTDPRSHIERRHHMHPSSLQKHIRKATRSAKIIKRVTVHTLRHTFATHLLEDGYDIRTIQALLGHSCVRTTMIYTHVVGKNLMGVKSPLDKK